MLTEGSFTARELSRILGIREKEVYEHLPHIQKSMGTSVSIVRQPATCLSCDFVFTKRERFTAPGRCPVCRSERISEPIFGVVPKNQAGSTSVADETRCDAGYLRGGTPVDLSGALNDCQRPVRGHGIHDEGEKGRRHMPKYEPHEHAHENVCEFEEDPLIPLHEERLRGAVEAMVASCLDDDTIDHVGAALIPSKDEIIRILGILQDVLFPGYFGRQELSHATLSYHLGNEMTRLYEMLAAQISRSIRHECRRMDKLCVKCVQKGWEESVLLMERLPELRRAFARDVRAHYDGDPASKSLDEIVFCYPGLYAIFVYRVAHELFNRQIPLIPRIMTEHAHSLTGIDIHPGATIGTDFFIDHGSGVVVGETTEIGNRVRIYQGVTLGALSVPRESEGGISLRGHKRHPTIEDDVTIYAQATILGGDTVIGARSVIGGNVWLTSSVPPDTTVLIETPRHVFKDDSNRSAASTGTRERS